MVDKLIQYEINDARVDDERLQLLTEYAVFYTKDMDAEWFAHPKTFNFASFGNNVLMQDVRLVLQSNTFNISERIGSNTYALCSSNIKTHYFVVRFSNPSSASNFNMRIRQDVNPEISCSTFWLTDSTLQKINSL